MTVAVVLLASLWSITPAHAQQNRIGATATTSPGSVTRHVGRRVTFVCPAITPAQAAAAVVYGTDVYTDDSPVCIAAIHAGVLEVDRAGVVTIVGESGADSFEGGERNGVTSLGYGPYGASYAFDRSGLPGQIDWVTSAEDVPATFAERVPLECPRGSAVSHPVWGSDVYANGSSICWAAVHAGLFPRGVGGRLALTMLPGQSSYAVVYRNGVQSRFWGEYTSSFRVLPLELEVVLLPGPTGTTVPTLPQVPPPIPEAHSWPLGQEIIWRDQPGATFTMCRESPPGAPCSPVALDTVALGLQWQRVGPLEPGSTQRFRVTASRAGETPGEGRLDVTVTPLDPPSTPALWLGPLATTGLALLTWGPSWYIANRRVRQVPTYQLVGPGSPRGLIVSGLRSSVPLPAGLNRYVWTVCSMVANPAGGWWYSPEATVLTYQGAPGSGVVTTSTAPCVVMPGATPGGGVVEPPAGPPVVLEGGPAPDPVNGSGITAGVILTYQAVAGAVSYSICRRMPPSEPCQRVNLVGSRVLNNRITEFDLGLPPATRYEYTVTAHQANGQLGTSAPIQLYTGIVRIPTNVRITQTTEAPPRVTLEWDPVSYEDHNGTHLIPSYQVASASHGGVASTVTEPRIELPLEGVGPFRWTVSAQFPDGAGGYWSSLPATLEYAGNQ